MSIFIPLIEPNKIYYGKILYQNLTSSFKLWAIFLLQKYGNNFQGQRFRVHHNTYAYQVTSICDW